LLPHPKCASDKPIEVAAGLLFRNGLLLIAQRRPGDHLGGLWEFPGGKREAGESFEACLERELCEELGIRVQAGELVDSLTHAYPDKIVHLRFYRCTCPEGEPQALGCHALKWIQQKDLDQYAFPAADSKLLAKLKAHPKLWQGL
jgi:8-oxo-dGTP diphosphatase